MGLGTSSRIFNINEGIHGKKSQSSEPVCSRLLKESIGCPNNDSFVIESINYQIRIEILNQSKLECILLLTFLTLSFASIIWM